ncbi:uncharacterized protein LOC127858762 [Dreissena polymorpha]|uniref:uncharacterized protein LOC127858762 n=1 Tax=Dreissena polymorpha TaxID=45954 RepID=UPI0022647AC1|nr:uncharacterized protein LOC127858762 [Dreissena polymorpha]
MLNHTQTGVTGEFILDFILEQTGEDTVNEQSKSNTVAKNLEETNPCSSKQGDAKKKSKRSDYLKTLQKQYFVSKLRLHDEKMKLIAAKMEMVKNQGEFYRNLTNALAQTRKMMDNEQ